MLDGTVSLVTGGAAGIGAASSARLAELGAHVVVADIDEHNGPALAERLGGSFVRLDVTDRFSWSAALSGIEADHGRLDLLHLNAGTMLRPRGEPIGDDPLPWIEARYDLVKAVNIDGVVYGTLACLPLLEKAGGSIAVTASVIGMAALPQDPVYTLTKHALVGFVMSMGPVTAARGVTMNAVCPGGVDTDLVPSDLRAQPAQELMDPAIVAAAVVHALTSGGSGEIWVTSECRKDPWLYEFPPPR